MELVSFAEDVLQNIAEQAASYRLGQSLLKQLDRGLWVFEKCARWAVPPPLDQDERPQPELVRPLPWVFFLMMLIALRVTRESISLLNLVMGKPPLRSADVVTFFQSKRRYLRTLKYQGNRMMRARTSLAPPRAPWYTSLYKMAELGMCFRRESYGNNNTTRVSNNDEVMVVKRSKRGPQEGIPAPTVSTDDTMERLIEKMMVDLDAESDEDSCYTLTNATGGKSDRSDFTIESDPETTLQCSSETPKHNGTRNGDSIQFSPSNATSSTPEKQHGHNNNRKPDDVRTETTNNTKDECKLESNEDKPATECNSGLPELRDTSECEDAAVGKFPEKRTLPAKRVSENMILSESQTPRSKIPNGRTVKSVPNKKKGPQRERLTSSELSQSRVLTSNNSF